MTEWVHTQGVHVKAAYRWAEMVGAAHGRRLIMLDDGVVTGDLVQDTIEVLTSLCAACTGAGRRGTGR